MRFVWHKNDAKQPAAAEGEEEEAGFVFVVVFKWLFIFRFRFAIESMPPPVYYHLVGGRRCCEDDRCANHTPENRIINQFGMPATAEENPNNKYTTLCKLAKTKIDEAAAVTASRPFIEI